MPRLFSKPSLLAGVALLALAAVAGGCDSLSEQDSATVTGRVIDAGEDAVPGAIVELRSAAMFEQTLTDSTGAYSFTFEISDAVGLSGQNGDVDTPSITTVELRAFTEDAETEGWKQATVQASRTTTVQNLVVRQESNVGNGGSGGGSAEPEPPPGPTGPAASITLLNREEVAMEVTVRGVGGREITQLPFVVYDDEGRRVGNAPVAACISQRPVHSSGVIDNSFLVPADPTGTCDDGAPQALTTTDGDGIAVFSFNSGRVAGIAQVHAFVPGATNPLDEPVESRPIVLRIEGGVPDSDHFSVSPAQKNFPFWGVAGAELNVVAILGDRYSNPVPAGAAAYFETNHGIVDALTFSERLGLHGGKYLTGAPYPTDGQVRIIARTHGTDLAQDETGERHFNLEASTGLLITGPPDIAHARITLPGGALQLGEYSLFVADARGNPIAESTITFEAQGNDVKVSEPLQLDGNNLQTTFPFAVAEADFDADGDDPVLNAVIVRIDHPGGSLTLSAARGEAGAVRTASQFVAIDR